MSAADLPEWGAWAERLRREEPELVELWFTLAGSAWSLGVKQTSADALLHHVRARLQRPVLNHTATVLARMWREKYPEREGLFVYRPSRLDGGADPGDPRQPELWEAA